ncbi:MAG: 2,3-bisphosphoglycerate-independent phosphoglycerate mutase [Oscillospiraceae bacterium]|jgi:2,3-bisphosphoglycerate-independent phosphoglycerate mutase|nr:2,3-bisphosphoglycerate-independent phosphoglycerate mutase [Oscillospiraceae bacterium]
MAQHPITALIILDGFGINPDVRYNAIAHAGTPVLSALAAKYPSTRLGASGMDVGLPDGQMGNSEVGHLNIGAGRVVYQELTRITKDIRNGSFFEKPELLQAMQNAKQPGRALHLLGLVSDGGVHSHNTHLYALLEMAKREAVDRVYIHCWLDGRDVPPSSGLDYVRQLQAETERLGVGQIATVMGRFWAMDRDNIWDRVQKAYEAMVYGQGLTAPTGAEAVAQSYAKGETDEFVIPTVITRDGAPVGAIQAGDSVVCFNFRPDRARQITRAFIQPDFVGFPYQGGFRPVQYVSMTQYDETFTGLLVVNKPESLANTLGAYLSSLGLSQLRIAETQKYAHVTFFFNGGVEAPNPGEERVLIDSPKIATFDMKPEMSAVGVTHEAVARVLSGKYDVMILNLANCDMVGHTGVMEAAEQAVRTVDTCVGALIWAVRSVGGRALITADHGNADQMVDPDTGEPFTAHTTNPVPLIVVDDSQLGKPMAQDGRLCDLAPTLLALMSIPQPKEMSGKRLI